ncbi:hypothetical protein SUGI_1025770 [Cryptomeria japonica]|uniref:uncharacterized protein LOC131029326 n=1 Tax=Cryptomeria japonica TaxID=3369 RepID=UPI0024149638|nr:uncharacterized protein LOC131029326 [Cryptomeria japonica]XP_057815751.2 uncharacterized protein LOC131029326 [Cryptomeria japonica]XP_059069321.1 uncharacterized protein LOC131859514 [Cryptomeria japonica]XP_059069322.1 uncharacterized protein LOC131859514 [Cryptomeria japonica]XP_059069324.1 uncharacterized protein LOC131859516 [Cryptomeria japonica]XP_059069325.1 uncharacterized protein LOC131859516 [Cryptomeria japonica]XP_059069391.1 uncharacterized protein LOC131855855 [Cryptomeria 
MDSMQANSDGQQRPFHTFWHAMAGISIPCTAVWVFLGFHGITTAMNANGLFVNVFGVGSIVASFIVAVLLVVTRARGTDRTIFLTFLNSTILSMSGFLAAFYTVQPSSYIISLGFVSLACMAFNQFEIWSR